MPPAPADATTIELGGQIEYTGRVQRQRHHVGARLADHRPVELGLVFKVDPETEDATQVELTGPAGDFVTMGDGIEVHGNTLAGTQLRQSRWRRSR